MTAVGKTRCVSRAAF